MGKRVMVVDDNEINGLMVQNMLEHFEVASDFFLSGEEALEGALKAEYALVLMDYLMPGMDGVETVRRLKEIEDYADVPVVALSGDTDNEIRSKFLDAGAVRLIGKPVSVEDISSILVEHGIADEETVSRKAAGYGAEGAEDKESDAGAETGPYLSLRSLLEGIKGLDYDKGLKNCVGIEKNYFYVIKAGIKNIENCRRMIGEYLEEEDSDGSEGHNNSMKQLRLAFHSLKSIFLNVGMERASSNASRYEKLVKELYNEDTGRYGTLSDEDNEVISRMHKESGELLEKLDVAAAKYDEYLKTRLLLQTPEGNAMDAEEYGVLVEKAIADTRLFDIDSITADIEKLAGAASSEKEKELLAETMDATGSFNYDLILENLLKIEDLLKMGRGEAR